MTKYRIYEIAKELNLDNKKVLGFLADHKITVKNHMSTVEAGVRDMIVKGLKANQGSVKEAAQNAARKVQEKAAQAAAPAYHAPDGTSGKTVAAGVSAPARR